MPSAELPYPAPYTLRQIEYFVAIADSGTISGAAAALHASDSAVADAVTALERSLGTTLLQRQRARGVTLTSDGLAMLPAARRLLMQAEEVTATVGQGAMSLTGLVRVGATSTLAPVVLALLIAELGRTHPELTLRLSVQDQPALAEQLGDGNLDILISHDIDVPPELSRTVLYSTFACVVLSAEHPLAARRLVRLGDLAGEPMVLLDIAASRIHTLELMSSAGITPRIRFRTDNYELCRSLVGRGLGYTLLMWQNRPRETWDGGKVAFVPIHPTPREVGVLALWRPGHLSARAAAVVDVLRGLADSFAGESSLSRLKRPEIPGCTVFPVMSDSSSAGFTPSQGQSSRRWAGMTEQTASDIRDAPVIDWFDQERMLRDPYPDYERMRRHGPVVHVPAVRRYLLTTHAAVVAAEQHPELFTADITRPTMVRALGARPMLRKDDPDHAAERGAINPALRPKSIGGPWSPRFRATVGHWLDHLAAVGPDDADLNRDFAAPVASQNLIDLVGFPATVDVEDMRRWSLDYIAGIGNVLDDPAIWARCDRSQAEVNAVLDDLLPRLRAEPDASVTSHLLQAGLPEDSVRANVHLTISGGMNEPQHMITSMAWALGTHPDQLARLRDGKSAWGDAFEETVRWLSPIGMIPRETTQDVEWLGYRIPAGTDIGLLAGSANRDRRAFDDPDSYDISRNTRGHVGFGRGTHLCAGRWAAKTAVGEIALPVLYERFPDLRVDDRRPTVWNGWVFRGITSLPVTW